MDVHYCVVVISHLTSKSDLRQMYPTADLKKHIQFKNYLEQQTNLNFVE